MQRPKGASQDSTTYTCCLERPGHSGQLNASKCCVGTAIILPVSCTATRYTGCQITSQISYLNKLLWKSRLELRKLSSTPGHISLRSIDDTSIDLPKTCEIRKCAYLVRHLMKTHHCITYVNISTNSFKGSEDLIRDALQENFSIKCFCVKFSTYVRRREFVWTILNMKNLQQIECDAETRCPIAFWAALTQLLRKPTSLKVLKIPNLKPIDEEGDKRRITNSERGEEEKNFLADYFLSILIKNGSLQELSLNASVIGEASPDHRANFSNYIASNKALKKVSFKGHDEVRRESLKWIVKGFVQNKSIIEASFLNFVVDPESAALVTEILTRNQVLKTIEISVVDVNYWSSTGDNAASAADYNTWLHALGGNQYLEAITLPLRICNSDTWRSLFVCLAKKKKNRKLKLIITGQSCERYLWKEISESLKGSGAEDNVVLATTVDVEYNSELLTLPGVSKFYAFPHRNIRAVMNWTFQQLLSVTYVTSAHLELLLSDIDETLSSAVTRYVATTTTLKKLHLTLWFRSQIRGREFGSKRWQGMCDALRRNGSIQELCIRVSCMKDEAVQILADAVKSSRTIRVIHLTTTDSNIGSAFVRRLRFNLEDHFNLVNVTVDGCQLNAEQLLHDVFVIHDVTGRNRDLIAGASEFMSSTMIDRFSARALQRVARHPALLQGLADQLSVSGTEIAAMVNRRLRGIETLDDFMRLAGVVRERVQCHITEDGRTQLDTLNEYCWNAIRCYLDLDDVLD